MVDTEEKNICDEIFKFITEDLSDSIDGEIFLKTTLKDLGEFYYKNILNNVRGSNDQLINAVISALSGKGVVLNCKEDYYCRLYRIIGIKNLPMDVLENVKNEYDEIFIQRYNLVMQKYLVAINDINNKLRHLKTNIDKIKNIKPNYSLMRDLSTDENKLVELSAECNSTSTRKEMLEFAFGYMNSCIEDFCDIHDAASVDIAQKRLALNLCKNNTYGADTFFLPFRDYIDIVEDDIKRPYALFYKVKIYIIGEMARKKFKHSTYIKSDEEAIEDAKNFISLLPKIDDLYSCKNRDVCQYNEMLSKIIADYELIKEIKKLIEKSVCLRDRKEILMKAIGLYEQKEFGLFNNILPIQIEGMFADYLKDATTFNRFSRVDLYIDKVLKDKIRLLQAFKSEMYPEAVEYFMYYFNNMIRNRIAHGKYVYKSVNLAHDEAFSNELFLDMVMIVYMLSRKTETEKMYRFVHGYKKYYENSLCSREHPCYEPLFNDMIGDKLISEYDRLEKYRPIQVAYWIVNPYYEKIYEQVEDKSDLLELREVFLSKAFWEYVLNKLNDIISSGYDYKKINMEIISIVKGLFRCNVSPETKVVLAKVNAALHTIKNLNTI